MATNITSKGQVTVPKSIRDYLGLKPGSPVIFEKAPGGEVILVDTNVLLDLVLEDEVWADWSQHQLETASVHERLAINPVIYH